MNDHLNVLSEKLSPASLQSGVGSLTSQGMTLCRVSRALWSVATSGEAVLYPCGYFEGVNRSRKNVPVGRLIGSNGEIQLWRNKSAVEVSIAGKKIGSFFWKSGLFYRQIIVQVSGSKTWTINAPRLWDLLSHKSIELISSADDKLYFKISPFALGRQSQSFMNSPAWIPSEACFLGTTDYLSFGASTPKPREMFDFRPDTLAPLIYPSDLFSHLCLQDQLVLLSTVLWIPVF